jgi:hypothetical protein
VIQVADIFWHVPAQRRRTEGVGENPKSESVADIADGGTADRLPRLPRMAAPLAKPSIRTSDPCLADALVVDCADSLTRSL